MTKQQGKYQIWPSRQEIKQIAREIKQEVLKGLSGQQGKK